ncbi:hypothetical protein [Streptococcus suis]
MKFEQLVLKNGVLKNIQYISAKEQLDSFNGEKGVFTRHEVIAEGQPIFHVITKGMVEKIPQFAKVELVGAVPVIDAVNGFSMTPALNVQAESIVLVN